MSSTTNSLRGLDVIADRIRQHRQVSKAHIVLVEGPDDELVLQDHLEGVDIFPSDGKRNVMRAIDQLVGWGFRDVTGVVDRDFDGFDARLDDVVFPYEGRDLESMLVGIGVLAKLLAHAGSRAKIEAAGGPDQLVARLISVAAPVAAIRAASHERGWGLAFDDVDLQGKVDLRTLELNLHAYCAALQSKSDTDASIVMLEEAGTAGSTDELGPRGKDTLAVAGVALRRVAGSLAAAAATEAILVPQLHSSAGLALSSSAWLEQLLARLHGTSGADSEGQS